MDDEFFSFEGFAYSLIEKVETFFYVALRILYAVVGIASLVTMVITFRNLKSGNLDGVTLAMLIASFAIFVITYFKVANLRGTVAGFWLGAPVGLAIGYYIYILTVSAPKHFVYTPVSMQHLLAGIIAVSVFALLPYPHRNK